MLRIKEKKAPTGTYRGVGQFKLTGGGLTATGDSKFHPSTLEHQDNNAT
jgi:hypothetical protein